jgi:uncharacterized protein YjiS (DUF1127 family)
MDGGRLMMKGNAMTRSETGAGLFGAAVGRRAGIVARIVGAHALWKSRRRLAALDEAALRDLGLTRTEALEEAERPVWNVPAHWLR